MEYAGRITSLTIDGQAENDFETFTESEVELRSPVNLMTGTGVMKKTPRRMLQLEYVVPSNRPERDWEQLENAVLIAEEEGGNRNTYSGVYCTKRGEKKFDGENVAKRTIELVVTGSVIRE